jgi:hypothetical protein
MQLTLFSFEDMQFFGKISEPLISVSPKKFFAGYNRIPEIKPQDFLGWARNLDTLILRNVSIFLSIYCIGNFLLRISPLEFLLLKGTAE